MKACLPGERRPPAMECIVGGGGGGGEEEGGAELFPVTHPCILVWCQGRESDESFLLQLNCLKVARY